MSDRASVLPMQLNWESGTSGALDGTGSSAAEAATWP